MLFLNSRTRNTAIPRMDVHDQPYTHKMGHTFIVCGCLSIITGLILVVIGVITEIRKTTFIGIGVISLGVGFFLMTLICLYGKLDICYNNWAYGSRILPFNLETPRPAPPYVIPLSPAPINSHSPITVISDVEIHKVVITPSVQIGGTTTNVT